MGPTVPARDAQKMGRRRKRRKNKARWKELICNGVMFHFSDIIPFHGL